MSDFQSEVIQRFARVEEVDSDDENILSKGDIPRDADDQFWKRVQKTALGMTKEQRFELKLAFQLIAGRDAMTIHEDKIYNLLLAIGYTFQQTQIDEILQNVTKDIHNEYSFDSLSEALDQWLSCQISIIDLKRLFIMIEKYETILPELPRNLEQFSITSDTKITKKSLKNCLNEILYRTGEIGDSVEDEIVQNLFDEISTLSQSGISFRDFVAMFRS